MEFGFVAYIEHCILQPSHKICRSFDKILVIQTSCYFIQWVAIVASEISVVLVTDFSCFHS